MNCQHFLLLLYDVNCYARINAQFIGNLPWCVCMCREILIVVFVVAVCVCHLFFKRVKAFYVRRYTDDNAQTRETRA